MNWEYPYWFSKAIDLQVDLIELDVHLSADGELMVIHDETVDRTTNGKGAVNHSQYWNWNNLKWKEQRIPTLSEVLNLINQKCKVNIELKSWNCRQSSWFNWTFYCGQILELQPIHSFQFWLECLAAGCLLNSAIRIGVLTEENLDLAFFWNLFRQAQFILITIY
jgi:glycerophosphoryl diester phosphodiesterase